MHTQPHVSERLFISRLRSPLRLALPLNMSASRRIHLKQLDAPNASWKSWAPSRRRL